jgi:hypothetical protein
LSKSLVQMALFFCFKESAYKPLTNTKHRDHHGELLPGPKEHFSLVSQSFVPLYFSHWKFFIGNFEGQTLIKKIWKKVPELAKLVYDKFFNHTSYRPMMSPSLICLFYQNETTANPIIFFINEIEFNT